ncbi:hypothetical protein [Streptomyces xanthii]|uniref:Uncharacterized protein n=1 Tax=Streptomyces xanthii TaxID=2768069 RepID=A0A7H1B6R0_9ACTN|nr:hypothetical protein [Streptomyces xanthii]QNS04415.1 hypothetical protein IAG42_12830 [Streptomyces xanthii]
MSWQHPREDAEANLSGVVYDPQQAAGAYDGYADPATVHGWRESATVAPAALHDTTEPLPVVPDEDGAVFVDTTGRRGRLMRRGGIALGAVCVVFLGVVVFGLFGASPSSGPLSWTDGDDDGGKQRAEHSAPAAPGPVTTDAPSGTGATGAPSATPSGDPDDTPGKKEASPAASTSRGTADTPATTPPPTTEPARGNSTNNPGRGNGSTKGPK